MGSVLALPTWPNPSAKSAFDQLSVVERGLAIAIAIALPLRRGRRREADDASHFPDPVAS